METASGLASAGPQLSQLVGECNRSYEAEARLLEEQLHLLGLELPSLPPEAQEHAHALAAAAAALGLREPSRTAFLSAVTALRTQQWALQDAKAELQGNVAAMQKRAQRMEDLQAALQQQLAELQLRHADVGAECLSKRVDADGTAKRLEQYEGERGALQEQLEAAGYAPQLQHSALLARRHAHEASQQRLSAARGRLALFRDLPPDAAEAGALMARRQRELAQLQAQLEAELGTLD